MGSGKPTRMAPRAANGENLAPYHPIKPQGVQQHRSRYRLWGRDRVRGEVGPLAAGEEPHNRRLGRRKESVLGGEGEAGMPKWGGAGEGSGSPENSLTTSDEAAWAKSPTLSGFFRKMQGKRGLCLQTLNCSNALARGRPIVHLVMHNLFPGSGLSPLSTQEGKAGRRAPQAFCSCSAAMASKE